MKQLLAFLGAGLKVSGDKTKFIGDVSQTLSHCFLHTKLLVHWVILLVANPHNLEKDVQSLVPLGGAASFSKKMFWWYKVRRVLGILYPAHYFAKLLISLKIPSKVNILQIIQLSRGKVLPERKNFWHKSLPLSTSSYSSCKS